MYLWTEPTTPQRVDFSETRAALARAEELMRAGIEDGVWLAQFFRLALAERERDRDHDLGIPE